MSTKTGTGRPEVAILNASLILGARRLSFTIMFHFVREREMLTTSASWKVSEPAGVGTQKTTRGTPSERTGVTTLVAPGPEVTRFSGYASVARRRLVHVAGGQSQSVDW